MIKKGKNERALMRQRINVTPTLLQKWKDNYLFDIRHVIHGSLMQPEDIGTVFEHQERQFEIIGMGESRAIMLKETRSEGTFFWETTRHFVQLKLERFNKAFVKAPGTSKTILRDMPYEESQLLLAPIKARRGAKVEEVIDSPVDEFEQIEDYVDEIVDETQTDLF
jgi:hypothetical protein